MVKVIADGALVTQSFVTEPGADGYSANAARAAEKAKELIGKAVARRCPPTPPI